MLATFATDRPLDRRGFAVLAGALVVAVVVAAVLPDRAAVRAALAVAFALALCWVCSRSMEQGLFALVGWLALLGLTRRLISEIQADPSSDPMLLVAPAGLAVLVAISVVRGSTHRLDWMAWGVIVFGGLMLVQVLNPDQGSLRAGVEGLLFWFVPMLGFWVGRVVATEIMWRLLAFVAGLAVAAGAYGIWQALVDFPPWDRLWIDTRGYRALEVSGPDTLRQFGFSASSAEYALTVSIGLLLCALLLARALRRSPRAWPQAGLAGAGCLVLAPALALSSVRTAAALTVVAFAVVFVAQRRWGLLRSTAIAAAAGAALVAVLSRIDTSKMNDHGVSGMFRRTIDGLGHPFSHESTLTTHIDLARDGLERGWHHPLGTGTSGATLASDRLNGGSFGTEVDVSNAAIAFGLLGVVCVVYLTVAGFVVAYQAVRRVPGFVSLATLGVLVLSLRFWWNGAHYEPALLLWLLLGWADAATRPAATS